MSKGSALEEVNTAYVGPYLPGRVPQHHARNAFSKAAFNFLCLSPTFAATRACNFENKPRVRGGLGQDEVRWQMFNA